MKVLFAGGGTGGHIFPIISIHREFKKIAPNADVDFFYAGPKNQSHANLLKKEGIKIKYILAGKIRRYFSPQAILLNIIDILFFIPLGIIQSFFYVFFLAPDIVFSKGGYGSFPVVFSSWLLGTPVILHESDITPGATNRYLSKFAMEIFVSFPSSKTEFFPQEKMISIGNPIRQELLSANREAARNLFSIRTYRPVILILGGSQGSQRINEAILQILPEMLRDFEIIHQCGEKNFKELSTEARVVINQNMEEAYHLFAFLDDKYLSHAYALADIIISRAGSGSIFEIAAIGKPSILIPLPEAAQNHQIKNAYAYSDTGACIVIEEANLTPHLLLGRLKYIFSRPQEMQSMALYAKKFARLRASHVVASYIHSYLNS